MTSPLLESIAQSANYADLPETWRVPELGRFSAEKTFYDYQEDAMRKAARALFRYYGQDNDWHAAETQADSDKRKRDFADLYARAGQAQPGCFAVKQYERAADRNNLKENPVFRILSKFIAPQGDAIPYHHRINRMCFWMATGSGKTLVMVKLIEYLHALRQRGEIPPHNILILAPTPHLLGQIRRTIDEFNRHGGLQIELMPLRQAGKQPHQIRLGDAITVYYHLSGNISDVQKEALTDYRAYENDGKWYVLLDEAHKGSKDDSKRQAYYAVMAREGFLFNFSATFTDDVDIVTTVKKYNLEEFVTHGHGKNICLNEAEYAAFKNRREEINPLERRKIVLKSLIALAHVVRCVDMIRSKTGIGDLYHLPMMLTLVNSVNTDVAKDRNDLWAFFETLRDITTGEIDAHAFKESKRALAAEWKRAPLLFGANDGGMTDIHTDAIGEMTVGDLREAVFLSRGKSALQYICSSDNKELAFQLKNADAPFALIRIGDTAKWRNKFLDGYEQTTTLPAKSFFAELERSSITILMGSRTFFESWDSNRPNVINFINIGGHDAKKFVVQSIGRGVRIEPLPGERRRLSRIDLPGAHARAIDKYRDWARPPETLFLFATNRKAVAAVLDGVAAEKSAALEKLDVFELTERPTLDGVRMPLLVPQYKDADDGAEPASFAMSEGTQERFTAWLARTSDSVLAVRDGLSAWQIDGLREALQPDKINPRPEKEYAALPFLQKRLLEHISRSGKAFDRVRELDESADIVHFREIRARPDFAEELREKARHVIAGKSSDEKIAALAAQLAKGEIVREEFDRWTHGADEETIKELKIKRIAQHYYLPVILGEEKIDYMQHIIKVQSEVDFFNALDAWACRHSTGWDAWMFSKIDESADKIHIPYYDHSVNEYRRFLPDFVFWMWRGKEYRIVFVDPKTPNYAAAYHKIHGYEDLFEEAGKPRVFQYKDQMQVSVGLLMFNNPASALRKYRRHWTTDPARIFQG